MARTIVLAFTLTLLAGCAGVYVAGDTGVHHDKDNLRGASVAAPNAGDRRPAG